MISDYYPSSLMQKKAQSHSNIEKDILNTLSAWASILTNIRPCWLRYTSTTCLRSKISNTIRKASCFQISSIQRERSFRPSWMSKRTMTHLSCSRKLKTPGSRRKRSFCSSKRRDMSLLLRYLSRMDSSKKLKNFVSKDRNLA